jgi:Predicted amidophosphoribosyltransferases
VKQRSSASCRHFARRVQSPSKAPSTLRLLRELCASHDSLRRSGRRIPRPRYRSRRHHEFKYNRQIHLRHLVARWLRAALDDERLRDYQFDVIVPVPLHPARQRERGFNQASLLANY